MSPDKGYPYVRHDWERGKVKTFTSVLHFCVRISVRIVGKHITRSHLQTYRESEFHIDGSVLVLVHRYIITG